MSDLNARVQVLFDRQDIADCLARYSRGVDRHDAELIASAYHPDAIDDHGTFCGTIPDFIAHVNGSSDSGPGVHAERFVSHHHYVTNTTIDLEGESAHTETYFIFRGELRDGTGTSLVFGRYIDRFERRAGRWAIAFRRVVVEGGGHVNPVTSLRTEEVAKFTHGAWDRTDASYERPLTISSRDRGSTAPPASDNRRAT